MTRPPLGPRARNYVLVLSRAQYLGVPDETLAEVVEDCYRDTILPTPEQLLQRIARRHYGQADPTEDLEQVMGQAA